MNLHDTMKQTMQLFEARIDDPNVVYKTYSKDKVETNDPSKITKIIAHISSYFGGSWTRLGKRYMELQFQQEVLKRKLKQLNLKITDKIQDETFDPIDEAFSRAVQTNDITALLARKTEKTVGGKMDAKQTANFHENVPRELVERVEFLTDEMIPELTKAFQLIIAAYTPKVEKKEVKPGLRVTPTQQAKEKMKAKLAQLESVDAEQFINEEYTDDIRYQHIEDMLKKFFNKYDQKLQAVSQGL